MLPRVSSVRHVRDYELELSFSDGTIGTLDFRRGIADRGGVFQPLHDVALFSQVAVDKEAGTIVWRNGVDFCPDMLYAEVTGKPVADLSTTANVT